MKSRLDRYNREDEKKDKPLSSRLSKNKHLYDDLNNKIAFEEISDFNTQTRIELTSLNELKKSRENYQQLKDYRNFMQKDNVVEEEKGEEEEEKIFDINAILEEARKNRGEVDELERKRNLKNDEYSILKDLNKEYISKKEDEGNIHKELTEKDKYEGLAELFNTITSKTLVTDIKDQEEKDLLSDLVATSVDLQVKEPKQYEDTTNDSLMVSNNEEENTSEQTVDNSFYTRSMDLSKDDFDFSDYNDGGTNTKRILLIVVLIIVLLIAIGVVTYFILQNMGITIFS